MRGRAHQALTPEVVAMVGMRGEQARDLGFDRLGQHAPCTIMQHCEQRIILDCPSWPRQPNDGILLHGVSL